MDGKTLPAAIAQLNRLMIEILRDGFFSRQISDLTPQQGLLLFNLGANEVTAGELKSQGYYQGSNVSYNLKKLIDMGYLNNRPCENDKRSVKIRVTEKGEKIQGTVQDIIENLQNSEDFDYKGLINQMRELAQLMNSKIRHIR